MDESLSPDTRAAVLAHVLRAVHPDRREAEVAEVALADDELLVGVKVLPRGYLSTARYALVTVDADGEVVAAEACTGRELHRALSSDDDGG